MDRNPATDWIPTSGMGFARWTAPPGVPNAPQDWGLLYTFSFVTNTAPSAAGGAHLFLGIEEAPGGELLIQIMGPQVP